MFCPIVIQCLIRLFIIDLLDNLLCDSCPVPVIDWFLNSCQSERKTRKRKLRVSSRGSTSPRMRFFWQQHRRMLMITLNVRKPSSLSTTRQSRMPQLRQTRWPKHTKVSPVLPCFYFVAAECVKILFYVWSPFAICNFFPSCGFSLRWSFQADSFILINLSVYLRLLFIIVHFMGFFFSCFSLTLILFLLFC